MVVFVAFFQPTQNADGTQLVGLIHHHRLETALQGLVFLEVFLVFVQRGGTDGPQFAARQCRFQYVGRVHGALASSGSHQGVNLVDEHDDAPLTARHLVDDALEPLLKFALVLRTGHQRAHVERVELFVFQVFGHVAAHNTLCQPLHDGGFARSRLTYQDRVVFRSAAQDLQQPPDFVVASDNGVEFALPRQFHQVLGIFLQTLVVVVGVLALHTLPLSKVAYGLSHVALGTSRILQNTAGRRVDAQQCQHQGLHAHKLVAQLLGGFLCAHQHAVGIGTQVGLPGSLHTRQVAQFFAQQHFYLPGVHTQFLHHVAHYVAGFLHESFQQVNRLHHLLAVQLSRVHGSLNRLLRLDGKFV